jgi:UDP-N-acetylmuramoyl-tripeptide--D-alanyl-D-alanine ligase
VFNTLGYDFENIDTQRISLGTAPWRGQMVRKNDITFLADCYNANPDSVKAGLQTFFDTPAAKRRVIILGDMLELGDGAIQYHQEIGRLLAKHDFDLAVFVGDLSQHTRDEALAFGVAESKLMHFDNAQECARAMVERFEDGDFVYVKASRGIGLEAVIEAIENTERAN